jgi:predicted XRE-type DNA-binding protein
MIKTTTLNKNIENSGIVWYSNTGVFINFFEEKNIMSKPISSQAARKAEGSTTIPEGSRIQADPKRPAPHSWGDDIVCSSWKREAALKELIENLSISDNGCWEWTGAKTNGYGCLKMPEIYGEMKILVSRLAWVAFKGVPIKDGKLVCHHCDNPPCFNPDHLFLGNQKENLQDCSRKKRTMTGSLNGNSKYTQEDIQKVLCLLSEGKSGVEIHGITGISRTHISRLKKGYAWTDKTHGLANHINHNRKYTDEQIIKTAQLIKEGELKPTQIARITGVTRYVVGDMKRGKLYQRFMERAGS